MSILITSRPSRGCQGGDVSTQILTSRLNSVTWITAAATTTLGLGITLPGLGNKPPDTDNAPKSILVVGGSSGCGAHAVQMLRFALGKTATIVATSSPQHHSSLQAIGASSCIARVDQGDVNALKVASPNAAGYDAVMDCVGAVEQQPQILEALKEDGPKLFGEVFTNANPKVPGGVNHKVVSGADLLDTDDGKDAYPYLVRLIEEGNIEIPLKIEVFGKGYEAIAKAIEKLHAGVSGTKLVASL